LETRRAHRLQVYVPNTGCKIFAQYQVCANDEGKPKASNNEESRPPIVRDLSFVIASTFGIRTSGFERSLRSQHTQPKDAQTTIVMQKK
jgi:hypothetical protein